MKRKLTRDQIDAAVIAFRDRMQFLETAWNAKTEYEIDLSTGLAWFKVRMPDSPVVLSVTRCNVDAVLLPGS
jgi:hypothetical protein